ncbi:unnamed protein product, partial [Iphiclides podalirius]
MHGRRGVLKYINFNARIPSETPRSRAAGVRRGGLPTSEAPESGSILQPTTGLGRYPRHYLAAFHGAAVAARPARAFMPSTTHAPSSVSVFASLSRFYALAENVHSRHATHRAYKIANIVFSAVLMDAHRSGLMCNCVIQHWIYLLMSK